MLQLPDSPPCMKTTTVSVDESYKICQHITAKHSKTFYLGTLLMSPPKRRAIWAIYAWCRRTDELVDGPAAAMTTPETLDLWEKQLELIFSQHPQENVDVALADAVVRYPLDIQPFRDMISGQRMDLYRNRYSTFDDLYLYCYRVAGTVGLMSTMVMGIDSEQNTAPWNCYKQPYIPINEAVSLGIACQLTNILRDVGEDAQRGRIYIPTEYLARFNYTEKDLVKGVVDDRWRSLMKCQIQRARQFYTQAQKGISYLHPDARLPVWAALMHYSRILNVIERNDYDVFSQRAYVPQWKKIGTIPFAWLQSQIS
ncbi:MAG: phytoene synthase [Rivularia sp. ALOHA_DT_140]|nr:phytoene synthase [Rivularia sp. ALOHA_DT_140]